jgi:hypothetical protein
MRCVGMPVKARCAANCEFPTMRLKHKFSKYRTQRVLYCIPTQRVGTRQILRRPE